MDHWRTKLPRDKEIHHRSEHSRYYPKGNEQGASHRELRTTDSAADGNVRVVALRTHESSVSNRRGLGVGRHRRRVVVGASFTGDVASRHGLSGRVRNVDEIDGGDSSLACVDDGGMGLNLTNGNVDVVDRGIDRRSNGGIQDGGDRCGNIAEVDGGINGRRCSDANRGADGDGGSENRAGDGAGDV